VWGEDPTQKNFTTPHPLLPLQGAAIAEIGCTALSSIMLTCTHAHPLQLTRAHSLTLSLAHSLTDEHLVYSWTIEDENRLTLLCAPEGLNGRKIRRIACGGDHVLMATDSGQLYSFGGNKNGQVHYITPHLRPQHLTLTLTHLLLSGSVV